MVFIYELDLHLLNMYRSTKTELSTSALPKVIHIVHTAAENSATPLRVW